MKNSARTSPCLRMDVLDFCCTQHRVHRHQHQTCFRCPHHDYRPLRPARRHDVHIVIQGPARLRSPSGTGHQASSMALRPPPTRLDTVFSSCLSISSFSLFLCPHCSGHERASVRERVDESASSWNTADSHPLPYSTGKPCLLHSLKPPAMFTTLV